jgi:tetratricopeptide (TPR) repeat protein
LFTLQLPIANSQLPTRFASLGLGVALCLIVACQRTPAPESQAVAPDSTVITFNKHIAPILFANCATCHRPAFPEASAGKPVAPGGAADRSDPICVAGAPFPLLDYANVQPRARQIAQATLTRAMPPWLPEAGHGDFVNARRLSDEQIALIQKWVEQGTPEGDPADKPKPPVFPSGWQLGTPDLVLKSGESYTLQAGRGDVFRNFVFPVPRSATRYVRAIEFRADNPRVLHHANVAVDPARVSRTLDRADPGPGFATMLEDEVQNVFGWSPGKVPVLEPEDTAWALEEGSDLVVQLHMVQGETPANVQPSIGLFLASTPPTRVPIVVKLESKSIDIPAGEPNYVIEDSYVLPVDVSVVSVYPHAHYLAREMQGTATLPDGTMKPLLLIKRWDVRWQDQYRFKDPLALPRGTTLRMRFTYDNSAANPRSPRPARRVSWGQNSTDEMGALWVEVVPSRSEDASVLTRDYFQRALATDIASAELLVRNNPRDAAAHNRLALKYVQASRIQDAQAQLDEALRLDANDAEAHSNLGTVLQMQGRLAEATPHLEAALTLKPNDDRIRFNLANGLTAAGRTGDAIRELQRAIAINPENADAHFNLAMLLGPQNRLDEAIAHLRRVIEINPRNSEAHRNLSFAYGLQGKLDDAITEARAALRIRPDSMEARQQLDRLLAARGQR